MRTASTHTLRRGHAFRRRWLVACVVHPAGEASVRSTFAHRSRACRCAFHATTLRFACQHGSSTVRGVEATTRPEAIVLMKAHVHARAKRRVHLHLVGKLVHHTISEAHVRHYPVAHHRLAVALHACILTIDCLYLAQTVRLPRVLILVFCHSRVVGMDFTIACGIGSCCTILCSAISIFTFFGGLYGSVSPILRLRVDACIGCGVR